MTFSIAFQLGASSSSSSPSIFQWNHDVFLSFKGKDVRHNFISHLNRALRQSGIKTYMDGIDLERREQISSELFKAIEESQISIIVFYKNYVESRWCLDELLKILECKKVMKQIVLPIFYKVKPLEMNPKIVSRIPLSVAKHPIGIELHIQDIFQHLRIFGTGGIGKKTISNDIYNQISSQFERSCFLRNIRETSKLKKQWFSQKYVNTLIFPQQKQVGGLIQLQNTLLSEILGTRLDINDVDRGIGVIWHRLQSKMILLILDDVDEMVQLEKLAGNRAWLGSGSRVIITTRDQHLLDNSKVDLKYEVRTLNVNKALQLFSLYAFEKNEPLKDFVDLSKQVTNYAQGLPLASTVLGSDLKGRSIHQWKSTLDNYDSLEDNEKDMFLDIAFFLKGEPLAKVMEIFDSCGFFPVHGIQRLIDKCLIYTFNYEYFWMHDLLRDMGQEIVREKLAKDLSKRSRLWFHEDVRQLRVLDWYKYPAEPLPHDFQRKKLIVFNMRDSLVKELGDGFKPKNLTIMTFYGCKFLKNIPDLSSISNLKQLIVQYCKRLVEVHDSVRSLKNLSRLDFDGCSKLQILPRSLKLRSLFELNLGSCSSLSDFPEIDRRTPFIKNLVGLETLNLLDCKNLMLLPIASIPLKYLHFFCMGGHDSVDLPNDSTTMEDEISNSRNGSTALQVPNIQISCSQSESNFFPLCSLFAMFNSSATLDLLSLLGLEIVSLPKSIKESVTLTNLTLACCCKLEEIPELPPNIRQVDARGCKSLKIFPEVSKILEFNRSHIKSLGRIELSGCYKMHENIWNDKVQNALLLWKVCLCDLIFNSMHA
ncbi:hypothetical protein I3842_15G153200 [Carya illinoinensis]|uniref:TIR domain-containing protein n=1 Tax=Carya illinoinensis TaxID=32201 RepID=A0A922A7H6_CARIL|nr:hypothetical protein I3842_15G153200 [Carya illinoinensis]